MPTRPGNEGPANEDIAPLLPLEMPRFAEIEDALPDLPITVAGPSIIEPTRNPINAKPEDETQSALDRFALGWLAHEAAPPNVETPFELPTFFKPDRNSVPDISLKPIVIPNLAATPEHTTPPERRAEVRTEPTLARPNEPEPVIVPEPLMAYAEPPPLPAAVPESVIAPALEPPQAVEPVPRSNLFRRSTCSEVKPAPRPSGSRGQPAFVGERNRKSSRFARSDRRPRSNPGVNRSEIKPAPKIKPAPAIEKAPEVVRAPSPNLRRSLRRLRPSRHAG